MAPFGNGRMIFNAEDPHTAKNYGSPTDRRRTCSGHLAGNRTRVERISSAVGTAYFNARDQAHGRALGERTAPARLVNQTSRRNRRLPPWSFTPYRAIAFRKADHDGIIRGREIWKAKCHDRSHCEFNRPFPPAGESRPEADLPGQRGDRPCSGQFRLATTSKVSRKVGHAGRGRLSHRQAGHGDRPRATLNGDCQRVAAGIWNVLACQDGWNSPGSASRSGGDAPTAGGPGVTRRSSCWVRTPPRSPAAMPQADLFRDVNPGPSEA